MNTLAIIGLGPRGLYALEKLIQQLSVSEKKLHIISFEPEDDPGAGQVWRKQQSESNWANITVRALQDFQGRPEIAFKNNLIEPFPAFTDWINYNQNDSDPDIYPTRSKIGTYLNERYNSLKIQKLDDITFKLIKEKVTKVTYVNTKLHVITDNGNCSEVDDVLITIGHQSTKLSSQLKSWKQHASFKKDLHAFENSYPISQFNFLKRENDVTIGIRGFGLAMVDVMRALATEVFGKFEITNSDTLKTIYINNPDKKITIVPFSLDGMPLAPKPLNSVIDQLFQPSDKVLESLKIQIETVAKINSDVSDFGFLTEPIAEISAKIFTNTKLKTKSHALNKEQIKNLVITWFNNENIEHELIIDKKNSTYNLIKAFIEMASNRCAISLDYCIGQVWRHCQPTIYKSLSHSKLNNDLIKKIIDLDDRIKRYSYGPPIQSMQQMLALVDAKVLNLDFVKNPKIELCDEGWQLINSKDDSITTKSMINSVLDAPELLEIDTPLIKNLLHDDLIQPIHSELGIETDTYGIVQNSNETHPVSIALLGRLSKGSVIGVDAILECFGKRVEDWAINYVRNLN
ncbi:FAD/NAD(P)-binding protein [Psychroserpens mesophilus]|uniref:FAD/NAD(P)-binding protein n=1 Tax=Psychroserpens mesophilus TaxID=325473 RepID=UPI00058C21E7|nr:FAD/NAD(P)-binding protein [Psychroserpens mesophilus]